MLKSPAACALAFVFLFMSCNSATDHPAGGDDPVKPIPVSTPGIAATLPHDTSYFTEGIEFYNGNLLEGTGLKERSRIVEKDFKTGKKIREIVNDPRYFGEGITVLHDTLYQLTYQESTAFAYTVKDFKKVKQFSFQGEGWGLTNDGRYLIATNGSSDLYYYNPSDFSLAKKITVTENGGFVPDLNEVEYVNGFVYANQFKQDYIYKIDVNTGMVVAKYDFSDLSRQVRGANPQADVLNGIAYDPATKKFYITGKNWPSMFEVQL